ncbi:MAG: (d)CMP kinase [Alphaproteobacteria bacterium]
MIIAIDGLAASGKGTIARLLARHFDYAHLDTGLLYRAVGVAVLTAGGTPADPVAAAAAAGTLDPIAISTMTDDSPLRTARAGDAASQVAAIPGVRTALLDFQRNFCAKPPAGKLGAVLDGRDIGTVIAPDAKVKIFVTASPEIRATRRAKELRARGENVTDATVLADMQARDARDQNRGVAPTHPASDARLLDTSDLSVDQSFAQALAIAQEMMAR